MQKQKNSPRQLLIGSAVLTVIFELITIVLRFGLRLESTRDTASTIGLLTFGLRIHHGYVGVLLALVAWGLLDHYPRLAKWGLMIGIALICSDMLHHFLVLWPITGSPQFDFVYPPRK